MIYRQGLEAIEYIAGLGVKITPSLKLPNGSYVFKYRYKAALEELQKTNPMAKVSDTKGFTADISLIRKYAAEGTENWKFIPADNGLFCLDVDRKEGKADGLKELLSALGNNAPPELQDIESRFPCYVKTPSNGYHLYFKYNGAKIKNAELFPSVETKHGSAGLTAAGSYKDGKPYILYGAIENAPPLYPILLEHIRRRDKPRASVYNNRYDIRYPASRERITLDRLAAETSGGHHDRQIQFAGKVLWYQKRLRQYNFDYSGYTFEQALRYVKQHEDIFGSGADTAHCVKSVFDNHGGM